MTAGRVLLTILLPYLDRPTWLGAKFQELELAHWDRSFTVAGLRLWNNLPFFLPYDSELTLVALRRLLQTPSVFLIAAATVAFIGSALSVYLLTSGPQISRWFAPV